ncbi:capsule polysaccharide synthase Cps1 [Diaporthe helianthi]|uniref:Capsule polysaccharide synthase Cps1 n=1 Tax=Diaporthe helianthi TaxID=158607 RepID=A0A2P5HK20_DIAHE|nr:capsule polysaccharide synthase Cps1 [Diaporthe helianthi]
MPFLQCRFLIVATAAVTVVPFLLLGDFEFGNLIVNATVAFWSLFAFRYFRLAVNIFSYLVWYKPSPIPANPSYTSRDVSVLIPTVETNEAFLNCVRSFCVNNPAYVFIITVGQELRAQIDESLQKLRLEYPTVNIQVHSTNAANKRRQIETVIPLIQTRLTSMADANVIWGPRFLRSALAPFEDPNICLVGTNKRVRRVRGAGLSASFWNFIGCLYLERHNFECRAQNAISGEVFVISGRTNVIRTAIIQDPHFRAGYVNERFLLGKLGPLAADDDNFIVRWILKQGGGIKFQYDDDACVDIAPIGEYPRFLSQCLRWARTTWRSNPAALKVSRVWISQPYSVYSIYLASFFNFAIVIDPLLVYLLFHSGYVNESNWTNVWLLVTWILCSKMVKLITYFHRERQDLLFFPFYILFSYYHSWIKFWALLTFWDVAWSGRNIVVDKPLRG